MGVESCRGSELHTHKLLHDRVCTVSLCAVGLFRLRGLVTMAS